MSAHLIITIDLGNAACSEPADVGMIVAKAATRICDLSIDIPWSLNLSDYNGNTVGTMSIYTDREGE